MRPPPPPPTCRCPEVSAGGLSGLLEILAARGGQDGLAELADDLSFEIDDLLPLVDAAVMLGLAHVHDAKLEITDVGRDFAAADIDTSKTLFGELIAARAPLMKAILRALRATGDGSLREGFFLDLLRRGFSAEEARRQLDIAIDWGRYGELFEYDAERGELILEPAEPEDPVVPTGAARPSVMLSAILISSPSGQRQDQASRSGVPGLLLAWPPAPAAGGLTAASAPAHYMKRCSYDTSFGEASSRTQATDPTGRETLRIRTPFPGLRGKARWLRRRVPLLRGVALRRGVPKL